MAKIDVPGQGAVKDVDLGDVVDFVKTGAKILKDLLKKPADKK